MELLNWKTLTRFKGIETLIFLLHKRISLIERHWPDLRGLKRRSIKDCSNSIWNIERHWPDLRGLKHYPLVVYLLEVGQHWKTLTRFKGIETRNSRSSFSRISFEIERHWPDLRGLKQKESVPSYCY